MKQKIIISIVAVLVLIQLKRIDKENPPVGKATNFVDVVETPLEVKRILTTACYDCHSYETKYPWYTNVAPLSWWIEHHIEEGRDEMNFSEWGNYSLKRKDHKLEEIVEMITEKEMPLPSYIPMHSEADLTEYQRTILINFAKDLRSRMP